MAKKESNTEEKRGRGRPTLYKPEYAELARKFCLLGATDQGLADSFEVSLDTIAEWKRVHEDFSYAVKSGKEQADANVASRLYDRAMGYEHEDTDIRVLGKEIVQTTVRKYFPPDTAAAIFWLKNRQRGKWRDRQDLEHSGPDGGPQKIEHKHDVTISAEESYRRMIGAK